MLSGSVGAYAWGPCARPLPGFRAAREGSRFGQPKALVRLDGQTLAERGVNRRLAGGTDPVDVVTGAAPLKLDRIHIVYNKQ